MRFLRRFRKSTAAEPSTSLDYRRMSEHIHERRIEREREPGIFRQNPDDARREVRTYRPEDRLRNMDEEARKLVNDARGIPRMWDREDSQSIRSPWPIEVQYPVWLFADAVVSSICLLNVDDDSTSRIAAGGIGILLNVGLLTVTIIYFRELAMLAWIGLITSLTFLVVLVASLG